MAGIKLTEDLLRGTWLASSLRDRFDRRLDALLPAMRGGRGAILAAETDPVDFLTVFFAAWLAGRPVVAANIGWGREEWRQARELTGARWIRATGDESELPGEPSREPGLKPGEVLIPTGGSSGRLRFARHSWETACASANGFATFFDARPVNSVCVLPVFHVSGWMQAIRALATGGTVLFLDWKRVEAGEVAEPPERAFLSLVPSQLRRLLGAKELHPWLRRFRAIPLGGAAAPAPLLAEAARLRLPIALSYGTTETAAMAASQKPDEFLEGDRSSGRPLPHVAVRILDKSGQEVETGREGRIFVSGPSLFHGYIPGEPRVDRVWFTGDLGHWDPAGRLVVTGREDGMIVTGGENVFPGEVERILIESGFLEDVHVFGTPDPEWGEAVSVLYVPAGTVSMEELRAAVKEALASFKTPKHWVPVVEIPRTERGKIDRRRVDALLREALQKQGAKGDVSEKHQIKPE